MILPPLLGQPAGLPTSGRPLMGSLLDDWHFSNAHPSPGQSWHRFLPQPCPARPRSGRAEIGGPKGTFSAGDHAGWRGFYEPAHI